MIDRDDSGLSARYRRFAEDEVRGRSPLYVELAEGVADDREIIAFLLTLPPEKRQPNLLLAAVRHLFGTPADWPAFRRTLVANFAAVGDLMRQRSTQTNEPARCATLLPLLALLPQPLALIEVGASAGLCLLPDCYGYDYGTATIAPGRTSAEPPVFACRPDGGTPLPTAMPEIAWRAGIDLNPLDPADPVATAWLETLVWPEQTDRLAHLRKALKIAAAERPRVIKGDLRRDLPRLIAEAPKAATTVVFHSAVLAYVPSRDVRNAFAAEVQSLSQFWIANESPRVFPDIAAKTGGSNVAGRFLLSVNGTPIAWTDPHGAALDWIAERPRSFSAQDR